MRGWRIEKRESGEAQRFMGLIPRLNSGRKKEGELKIIVRVMVDVVGGGGEEEWVDGQMEGGREGCFLLEGQEKEKKRKRRRGTSGKRIRKRIRYLV